MSWWSRALIGSAGLILAGAGLIAVFIKDTNVAGVPLLILAGAAFLYVALTAQRLIQVTKDGVTFEKAARLAKTLDEVTNDPEIPDETKARIAEVAEDNGVRLSRPSEWELELSVRDMFERIGRAHGFEVQPVAPDAGADFQLVNSRGRKIGVEVKGKLRMRQFSEAIRQLRASSFEQKLLVLDGSVPSEFEAFRMEGIWVLGWDSQAFDAFTTTLRSLEFLTA